MIDFKEQLNSQKDHLQSVDTKIHETVKKYHTTINEFECFYV